MIVFRKLGHNSTQRDNRQQIGNDHQTIKHIGYIPYQRNLLEGVHDDECKHNDSIQYPGDLAAFEQDFYIALTKEVSANNGREGKEQQANRHEGITESSKGVLKGNLCQCGAVQHHSISTGGTQHTRGQNHQSRHRQHDKGINGYVDHGNSALILGLVHLGQRMSMRRGTHTSLIGKQAARDTEAHGLFDANAQSAAHDGLRIKSTNKNRFQRRQDVLVIHKDQYQKAYNIEHSRQRNKLLSDSGKGT